MSKLGLGALHFGTLLDKEASRKVILKALELGIRFFDTAPLYGNTRSEEILGDIFAEVREETFVCTKVGLESVQRKDNRFGVEVARLNAETLNRSVERSLQRLKRETIDLLMLHAFDDQTPLEETLHVVSNLYQNGKIRNFGCSNYNPQQLQQLFKYLPSLDVPFMAAQCHYNLIERRAAKTFLPLCQKQQVSVVVNRALARGALSGQYAPGQQLPQNSRAAMSARIQKWLTPSKLMLLEQLSSVAKEHGSSLMNVSLQWLLKNHPQTIVLVGARNTTQLEQCVQASTAEIDPSVFVKIETLLRKEPNVYQNPPRYFEK